MDPDNQNKNMPTAPAPASVDTQPTQPIQPVQDSTPQPKEPVNKSLESSSTVKPKERDWTKIILLLLIPILFAIMGILGYQNYQLNQKLKLQEVVPIATITPSPSPTATTDPTAGWEIYVDRAEGYSIKYPSDLFLVAKPDEWNDLYQSREAADIVEACMNNPSRAHGDLCKPLPVISFGVYEITPAMYSTDYSSAKEYVEGRLAFPNREAFTATSGVVFETTDSIEGAGMQGLDAYTANSNGDYYEVITRAYLSEGLWGYLHEGGGPEYNSDEWFEFVKEFEDFSKKLILTFEFTE